MRSMLVLLAGLMIISSNVSAHNMILDSNWNVTAGVDFSKEYPGLDSRLLHMVHPAATSGDTVVGLRLEVDGLVDGGIMSAYRSSVSNGGLYLGTLSKHRLTLGTNSADHLTITPEGKVGIGTHKAAQALHVQGSAYIFENLGIGIDSPTNALQVSGSSALFSSDAGSFNQFISKKSGNDIASIIFQDNYSGRAQLGLINNSDFRFQVSTDGVTYRDAFFVKNDTAHIGVGDPNTTGARFSVIDKDGGTAIKADSYEGGYSIVARKDGAGGGIFISKLDEGTGNGLYIIHNGSDPALVIEDSFSELLVVQSGGNVGIGTAKPKGTLDVNGQIFQRGKVLNADYVFEPDYKLESIREHAEFMWTNKHLGAIPKAVVDENGNEIVEIGTHQRGIVEELEKAHIYIEQLHKEMEKQNSRIEMLEERLLRMEARN